MECTHEDSHVTVEEQAGLFYSEHLDVEELVFRHRDRQIRDENSVRHDDFAINKYFFHKTVDVIRSKRRRIGRREVNIYE